MQSSDHDDVMTNVSFILSSPWLSNGSSGYCLRFEEYVSVVTDI